MRQQRRTPDNLPEAIDNGEDISNVLTLHLKGEEPTEQQCREIARSLRTVEHLAAVATTLSEEKPDSAARILLAACSNGRTPIPAGEARSAADTLQGAAEGARWDLRQRLRTIASQIGSGQVPETKEDPEALREERILGRRLAREDELGTLANSPQSEEASHAAAHTIHLLERRSDLLSATYDPPEPLRRALAAYAHQNPHHPPVALHRNHPARIAARLHQASTLGGTQSPAGARWLHPRHPVLWLTGHDEHPAGSTEGTPESTPEANMEALQLTPPHWWRHAVNASRRSRASIMHSAAHGLTPDQQQIVHSLTESWTLGLEDLRRTARILSNH